MLFSYKSIMQCISVFSFEIWQLLKRGQHLSYARSGKLLAMLVNPSSVWKIDVSLTVSLFEHWCNHDIITKHKLVRDGEGAGIVGCGVPHRSNNRFAVRDNSFGQVNQGACSR